MDERTLQGITARAKQQLRQRLKATRRAVPGSARAVRSSSIVARLLTLSAFNEARGIGLYWPLLVQGEVDVRELDRAARAAQKRIYYPFMDPTDTGHTTGFRAVLDATELIQRGHEFLEPLPDRPAAVRGDIDLMIVPALGATTTGHRLGYGSGFYDATLGDFCPPAKSLIAIYGFQLLAELPVENQDVRCDFVVTEDQVYGEIR